jgi:hypothetical protein
MKILISFYTYPRDGKSTYTLLENTFKSLNLDIESLNNIKIFVIGDDYANLDELKPIFKNFDYDFFNINIDNALRNKNVDSHLKWQHAVTRSIIFSFEKALELDYDYILVSADDEIYLNNKIEQSLNYINKYNYPDFVFSLAIHVNKTILPRTYDKNNLMFNYPMKSNLIESGTLYYLKNTNFINDIINFRKKRWEIVEKVIKGELVYNKKIISAEDAELWDYLLPKFKNKTYTSLLIPEILIDHFTEGSINKFIKK